MTPPSIAVLIPCLNEELTVARVVREFREQLPEATVYVFDNGSSDRTRIAAASAGAVVRFVPERGKGNVVRAMFTSVDADIYVLVDGDATYPAASVRALVDPVCRGMSDMVVGSRLSAGSRSHFRAINRWGNLVYAGLVSVALGVRVTDVLSGYRALSGRFVRSLSVESNGFEIEMELTIAAAKLGLPVMEVPVDLVPRPAGSRSKINIVRDGWLILRTMALHLARPALTSVGDRV